jgi:hypothetical protein
MLSDGISEQKTMGKEVEMMQNRLQLAGVVILLVDENNAVVNL